MIFCKFRTIPIGLVFAASVFGQQAYARVYVDEVGPGWDAADATACLKNAIAEGGDVLVLRKMPGPWIIGEQIDFDVDGQKIVFEEGVEIVAKEGAFSRTNHNLFRIWGDNVTLSGYGATLRMRKSDYQDETRYEPGEWRHAVSIRGAQDFLIEGLYITQSGGDGINVSPGWSEELQSHGYSSGTIRDVVCDDNHRQGISVISAKGLLIENSVFKNTDGTLPMAGIDIEPNGPSDYVQDIVVRDCRFLNNSGHDIKIALYHYFGDGVKDVGITFENCVTDGSRRQALQISKTGSGSAHSGPGGFVKFIDCRFQNAQQHGITKFGDDHSETTWTTIFRNSYVINCGRAGEEFVPIGLGSHPSVDGTVANLVFDKLYVIDDKPRPAAGRMVHPNSSVEIAEQGLQNVRGTIIVENPYGVSHEWGDNWADSDLEVVAGSVPVESQEAQPEAGDGSAEGGTPAQASDGGITLHARNAIVHGTQLRYEPEPEKNCLGFWTEVSDWAEWRFDVARPGAFHVEVLQGCGEGQGGSEVLVEVGGREMFFVVEDTGHFQNFVPLRVGKVSLAAGSHSLSVKPQTKAARAVMDIREVRLVPVSD